MGYLIVGFQNTGTFCYLNSVIQLLLCATAFNEYIHYFCSVETRDVILQFVSNRYPNRLEEYTHKCDLLFLYHMLLRLLRHEESSAETRILERSEGGPVDLNMERFLIVLNRIRPLERFAQHDVYEVFNLFLTCFQEVMFELTQSSNDIKNCVIHPDNSFQGKQRISHECQKCGVVSSRNEIFNDLSCVIFNNNLESSILNEFKPEDIDDFQCDACKSSSRCTRKRIITEYPKYLVIHLHRNQFEQGKNQDDITHVPVLRFNEEQQFKFKGAIEHHGSWTNWGHYTTKIDVNGNGLALINDQRIQISNQPIEKFFPYLLMYERFERFKGYIPG